MKTVLPFVLLIILGTLGCKDKNLTMIPKVPPKDDIEALYQRFHGKYKVVSSTSSQPLDVNFDGVSSTNLLEEILELNNYGAFLELRVKYSDRSVFLFNQFWPEQYVHSFKNPNLEWNGWDALDYSPTYNVMYAQQTNPYSFSFNDDLSQIVVLPHENPNTIRWAKPESVFVEENNRLRIINKRRIYTREGVKEVLITTIYERFTMTT